MTANPKLDNNSIEYIFETAELVLDSSENRRAGSADESQVQHIFMNELIKYCDETTEDTFKTHPGAGTLAEKILSLLLILCVILFSVSVNSGTVFPSSLSLVMSLGIFCTFAYKFIFDGKKLDFITPSKRSKNILGVRCSRGETKTRIVLVGRSDSPQSMRGLLFRNSTTFILSVLSLIGNSLLFCGNLFFLFSGAPENSGFFMVINTLCLVFIPFYIASVFVINNKKVASGISTGIIPSAILLSIMKQFHDNSFRYEKTEVCCLISGSEYSSRAGSYAFASKYKRRFSDVPTIFIPIEELTTSRSLSVFFRDGSGINGSSEVASVIGDAAENLSLTIKKENFFLGSSTFTPFSKYGFSACSIGTSKRHISKGFSANADTLEKVSKASVSDMGALIIETLNYYDG